jgi:hypothetical protein
MQEMGLLTTVVVAGVIGVGGAVIAAPIILAAVGFGAAGPVAGSTAASYMATAGPIQAGSIYATLQSWGMTGALILLA